MNGHREVASSASVNVVSSDYTSASGYQRWPCYRTDHWRCTVCSLRLLCLVVQRWKRRWAEIWAKCRDMTQRATRSLDQGLGGRTTVGKNPSCGYLITCGSRFGVRTDLALLSFVKLSPETERSLVWTARLGIVTFGCCHHGTDSSSVEFLRSCAIVKKSGKYVLEKSWRSNNHSGCGG